MKILHIVCTAPPYKGGMGNSALRISRDTRADFETVLATIDYGENGEREADIKYLKPLIASGNAAVLPGLIGLIKDCDIVHFHYPLFGSHLITLVAVVLFRKKVVLHYHMDVKVSGLKGAVVGLNRLILEKILVLVSKKVVASSADYIENSSLSWLLKTNSQKIESIPFGIDTNVYQPAGNKDKTILFVGGLDEAHYFKGLDLLLESISALKKNNALDNWVLKIIGSGNRLDYFKEKVTGLQISDCVKFLGKLDDQMLIANYQAAGILILPSINQGEAFGLVLIEAMSCGTPVIASNLPGVRTVFENEEQGLFIEPGDLADLTDAIRRMVADEPFRLAAGVKSRQLATQKYDRRVIANRYAELYKKL